MKISKIKVKNKSTNYQILIGKNIIKRLGKEIKSVCPNANKVAIIFDKKIPKKFKKNIKQQLRKYKTFIYEYHVNENLKSFNKANLLAENLLKRNFNRNDIIVSAGGGIVGDFSSFVASILKRGINFINLPSTLLAQVDSSIGGKTGINSKSGKNLIGSFYQPKLVVSELNFLRSLPKREMVCGFAEILKHSIIYKSNFFNWLDKNSKNILDKKNFNILGYSIAKSCKIKLYFVNQDEREKNKRMILNFGHTFAHGIEAASNFSRKINHGEAVLIGMLLAVKLSVRKGLCSESTLEKISSVYFKNSLPNSLSKYFKKEYYNKIAGFMASDKKNNDNKINLILLRNIGKTTNPGQIKVSLKEMKKILKNIK